MRSRPSRFRPPGCGSDSGQTCLRKARCASLYMSQNIQHGDGGTCFGDSGGPTFFVDPSSHAEYIVAVTSWGDSVCKSTNNNYRVDLASSRSFIDDMIASNP